jgi:hypothetical protein
MSREQVIHIHVEAPPLPQPGQPCNGCGVCCLAEPCPIGMVVSRKRSGACTALRWQEGQGRYVCGVLDAAAQRRARAASSTGWMGPMHRLGAGLWWRWVRRHIAASVGCDADFAQAPPTKH